MKKIRTVCGDIGKSALGWCQSHEHIFLADGPSRKINKALCMDDYHKSKQECLSYKRAGGMSLVDCQPGGFGRMAHNLRRVSEKSGVHIIGVTGYHKLMFAENPDDFVLADNEDLVQRFVGEIETEMVDHGRPVNARAGVIKCAIEKDIWYEKTYQKLFDAVCRASRIAWAPILVHFDAGTRPLDVLERFYQNGVQPKKLIFCHLDRAESDMKCHKKLADSGVFLEYDTINRLKYHDNQTELTLIKNMIEAGYQKNLLLSMDTTNERLNAYGAPFGLDYILKVFRKEMRQSGIKESVTKTILVDNAAEALAF